mmetsp:Transcript_31053/g.23097  ORF Transcript_31053/g.23097 Transcript_31053/m.23097 type:complete len:107 (+) Transcript_31053:26-346(+)
MNISRTLVNRNFNALRTSVRHGGGYFKKNIWIEENAGLRENTYLDWKFTFPKIVKMFWYMVLPVMVIAPLIVEEQKLRDKQAGKEVKYGWRPIVDWAKALTYRNAD